MTDHLQASSLQWSMMIRAFSSRSKIFWNLRTTPCARLPLPRPARKRLSRRDRLPDLGHRHAVMDGFELLRAVHAARPELPIILITGHPEMLNRLPPIDRGHYRLFKKPFNGPELLTAISEALRNPLLRHIRVVTART